MKLKKIVSKRFVDQSGLCFYCTQPMWIEDGAGFARQHGISQKRARALQATAEHLVARSDGGNDSYDNVVAACRFCNEHRHRPRQPLPPERHLPKVRKRLKAGAWHGLRLGVPQPVP
jgi:5-methylcytosine-specific restriction endonuclease McrA